MFAHRPTVAWWLASVALGLASACGDRSTNDAAFRRLPGPVLHLAEVDGEVLGPPAAPPRPMRVFGRDDLRAWTRTRRPGAVAYVSPDLSGLSGDVGLLRLRLRPGGAKQIVVRPRFGVANDELHRLDVPLGPEAVGDDPITIEVDLARIVASGWKSRPILRGITVEFQHATRTTAALEEVVVEDAAAGFADNAGRERLDLDGVVRPGWYVRGGRRVRFAVDVPTGAPELRWWGGAHGVPTDRALWATTAHGNVPIGAFPGTSTWTARTADLTALAGERVTLVWGCAGDGICLIGDPRIVDATPRARPMDVIVYMIDTLRADRLGAFGDVGPEATPVMDRLAREGVAFSFGFSTSSWTKPAIVTLMTGVQPTTHRIGTGSYAERVPPRAPLVQERFRAAGWRTGSFTASPLGSTLSGLERGFGSTFTPQHWGEASTRPNPTADQLHEAVFAWIDEAPDEPFFAYVHTLEAHDSWDPAVTRPVAYDRGVERADRAMGGLLDGLRRRGRLDDLLLVVVSDHGESLGEKGALGHGNALIQSQIHIPIIFWAGSHLHPRTVDAPVSLIDLPATLTDLFGLPDLPDAEGMSLRALLGGSDGANAPPARSSLLRFVFRPTGTLTYSIVMPDGRKVVMTSTGDVERYDLRADPDEAHAITQSWPDVEARLSTWLDAQEESAAAYRARYGAAGARAIEDQQARRLRALGYIE